MSVMQAIAALMHESKVRSLEWECRNTYNFYGALEALREVLGNRKQALKYWGKQVS